MRRVVLLVLFAALAVFLYVEVASRLKVPATVPEKFTPAVAPPLDPKSLPGLAALDAEYTRLVESVVPSVVSINSSRTVRVPVTDLSDYLFGWRGRVMEKPESSLGSGVIVSKEGHILTNHHVVSGMQDISVRLTDGRELAATLVGSEPSVDLAVLHVNVDGLPPLPLSDSDLVRVGQMVFAVGNPFGLQETVTRGIVSAKGRALRDSGVEFFQTDAAVNPGNSGGPLLNTRGEIIGINSAIYSQSGAWAGISFAIPANVAKRTLESILKSGRPVRGTLGVNMVSLSPGLAARLGLPDNRGAYVADVDLNSPAERAGIRRGDVVRTFNGKVVKDANVLRDQIAHAGVGAKVELGVVRGGREQRLTMQIEEMPSEAAPTLSGAKPNQNRAVRNALSGLTVEDIRPDQRAAVPASVQGVIVTQVAAGSSAASTLQEGDIIEEINRRAVPTKADYDVAVQAIGPNDQALLRVVRGRTRAYAVLNP